MKQIFLTQHALDFVIYCDL